MSMIFFFFYFEARSLGFLYIVCTRKSIDSYGVHYLDTITVMPQIEKLLVQSCLLSHPQVSGELWNRKGNPTSRDSERESRSRSGSEAPYQASIPPKRKHGVTDKADLSD